jgi:CheY-like chemotaxis protein
MRTAPDPGMAARSRSACRRRHRRCSTTAPVQAEVSPLNLLIVDDNRDSADSLTMLLRLAGHAARQCYSGDEAMRILTSGPAPDVILLDIGMPGMNGYDVARRIRDRPALANTRIIAVTGYGQTLDQDPSKAAAFDDHLLKPVHMEQLQAVLRSVGQRKHAR